MNTSAHILVGFPENSFKKIAKDLPPAVQRVHTHTDFITYAKTNTFTYVVSALEYSGHHEGLEVLERTRNIASHKLICAQTDTMPGFKQAITDFGGDILFQHELLTLHGFINSNGPLKKEGKILVFFRTYEDMWGKKKDIEKLLPGQIVANSYDHDELIRELEMDRFRLIIDTTTAGPPYFKKPSQVAKAFAHVHFTSVPKLICLDSRRISLKYIENIVKNNS